VANDLCGLLVIQVDQQSKMIRFAALCIGLVVVCAHNTSPLDTRGPVKNASMNVTTNSDGVFVPGYKFVNNGLKPSPWHAQWITIKDTTSLVSLLRAKFDIKDNKSAQAWFTASSKFLLYLNEHLIARGPADSGRDWSGGSSQHWFYNHLDISPYLQNGTNVIAVQMFTPGASFLFEAEMDNSTRVLSNDSWRGIGSQFARSVDNHWQFDGTQEPINWQSVANFNDSSWTACVISKGVGLLLVVSELPPLMEVNYPLLSVGNATGGVKIPHDPFVSGSSVTVTASGSFIVRFNRIMGAYAGISVRGGAGASVELRPKESVSGEANRVTILKLRSGVQYFEAPEFASFSVIQVVINNVTSQVDILDISAVFTSIPVSYRGDFTSSDMNLNQIWKNCRWATQINMQTWHLDSTHNQVIPIIVI
jgi:alpha-L-rhamnosidase